MFDGRGILVSKKFPVLIGLADKFFASLEEKEATSASLNMPMVLEMGRIIVVA